MALASLKGKIPKEIPFELKRCESCRRAKQGAIVCRVVRAHDGITEPDGGDWAPPEGFREWLAAWKAGDGKSTIRTPTKKPKRPRPPPKPVALTVADGVCPKNANSAAWIRLQSWRD